MAEWTTGDQKMRSDIQNNPTAWLSDMPPIRYGSCHRVVKGSPVTMCISYSIAYDKMASTYRIGILFRVSSTTDCSFQVGGLLWGLPIRAGDTIISFGVFLNLAHGFCTYLIVIPIDSAMMAFLVPFLFSATIYSTFDWSNFFITRTRQSPILCHRTDLRGRFSAKPFLLAGLESSL